MLRTRAPLDPKVSFDLHVLGMPPAFVLSQDQTLKFISEQSPGWNFRMKARFKELISAQRLLTLFETNLSIGLHKRMR